MAKKRPYNKEYYLKHKDKIAQQVKKYRTKNKDKIRAYRKKYYLANRERLRQEYKERYLKNIDKYKANNKRYIKENESKVKASRRRHYFTNKEKLIQQHQTWVEKNKEKIRAYERNYYITKRKNNPEYKEKQKKYLVEYRKRPEVIAKQKKYAIEQWQKIKASGVKRKPHRVTNKEKVLAFIQTNFPADVFQPRQFSCSNDCARHELIGIAHYNCILRALRELVEEKKIVKIAHGKFKYSG